MSLSLKKLEAQKSYFDQSGRPTMQMQIFWQQTMGAIEAQVDAQAQMIADIQEALETAGIALNTANASMPDVPPVTIAADYTGTIAGGQLPRNIQATRLDGATDVTTSAAWSAATDSGSITYTIGAATGIVNVTAIVTSSVLSVTSIHNGISRTRKVLINKQVADPPNTGAGGGTSATDTSFLDISTTIMAAISNELTVTVGSVGEVDLNALLDVYALTSSNGTYPVYGIWQWYDGASWVDLGTEFPDAPSATISPSETVNGFIGVSYNKTGLTPASSQKFRLMARNDGHTVPMGFTGTASAVAS